ncbi:Uncharacterised protein [uncultured Comamonas sp.]|nr:Uncharacterised protein [uncultured Comamonas sp.]
MATSPAGKKPEPRKITTTKKPATTKLAGKAAPDWERIELDYRAGIKTLRQIADENGISHTLVARKAKQFGWTRDLSAKIHAKADELVSKEAVYKPVTTETRIAEREVIDANARAVADVRLAHRKDIHRARKLTNALLDELEQQTDPETLEALRELGDFMRRPDDNGQDKLNDLYHKVISLSERSKTMKTLAESLQKLVDMERTAFGMDKDVEQKSDALASLLGRISAGNSSGFAPVADDPERRPSAMPIRQDQPGDED